MSGAHYTSIPIPYAFDVVDSGAWVYFLSPGGHHSAYEARRALYASGLVQYILSTSGGEVGAIQLRSYDSGLTVAQALLVERLAHTESARQIEDAIRAEIWRFCEWLDHDVSQAKQWFDEIDKIAAQWAEDAIRAFTGEEVDRRVTKPRGRPERRINERVRQRLNAGDPIDQIRSEYLAHESPESKEEERLASDRFRKLVKSWEQKQEKR